MTEITTDYRALAETLMSDLAAIFSAYKDATYNHPDDGMRILHIGHTEASIRRAFKALYGRDMEE